MVYSCLRRSGRHNHRFPTHRPVRKHPLTALATIARLARSLGGISIGMLVSAVPAQRSPCSHRRNSLSVPPRPLRSSSGYLGGAPTKRMRRPRGSDRSRSEGIPSPISVSSNAKETFFKHPIFLHCFASTLVLGDVVIQMNLGQCAILLLSRHSGDSSDGQS